jgi:hypothetical protein
MTYFFPYAPKDFQTNIFSYSDLLFAPIFIFALYKACEFIYNRKYRTLSYGKYFMLAVKIKLACSIVYWAVAKFYYKGGDTYVYYWHILKVKQMMFEEPLLAYNVLFDRYDFQTILYMRDYFINFGTYIHDGSSYIVIFIGFFLGFLGLFSYINTSALMSIFALMGCWRLFKMFREMYPHLEREMAIATLFIPSVLYWGCGIMKDSLCVGFLGILTYATYEVAFKRRNIPFNLLYISFSIWALVQIKVYIILAYAPALAVWIFARYRYNITSPFIKAIATPLFLTVGLISGISVLTLMGQYAEKYALESMMRTAQDTQNWLVTSSKVSGGSFYTLGDIEYSTAGMLKIFPKAVNVSLFRPYLWEAKKPMLVPAAIEGVITFYITVRLIFRSGFINFFKMITSNPEVQFCLIFAIIFAFSVGFTSFNFGALARYKIPFMPYYYIAMFILADSQKKAGPLMTKN